MNEGIRIPAAKSLRIFAVAAALLVAWGFSGAASADMISIEIEAMSAGEASKFVWTVPEVLDAGGRMTWSLPGPLVLMGSTGVIGTVDAMTVGFDADPGVSLSFALTAGASDTTFTSSSSIVSFSPIAGPTAYASAGTTVTDTNSNGASLTGLYAGGKAYKFMYNSPSVDWAYLVNSSAAGADMTSVTNDRMPATGRVVIPASIFQIQSQYHFTVSAFDQVSGTSYFYIGEPVPEPGTMMLMGTAALMMTGVVIRRRMKN